MLTPVVTLVDINPVMQNALDVSKRKVDTLKTVRAAAEANWKAKKMHWLRKNSGSCLLKRKSRLTCGRPRKRLINSGTAKLHKAWMTKLDAMHKPFISMLDQGVGRICLSGALGQHHSHDGQLSYFEIYGENG